MRSNSARRFLLAIVAVVLLSMAATAVAAETVSLTARRDFPVDSASINVVAGDFNRDGAMDMAVANYFSGTVSVLLGNGDGSFRPATSVTVGANPWGIAVGDFNGDGVPDLAVTNNGTSTVSILLGNGDGTFRAGPIVAVVGPRGLAAADLNGDGKVDLVIANYDAGTVS